MNKLAESLWRLVVRRRADLIALALMLGLAFLFLWRPLLTQDVLLPADILYQHAPWSALASELDVGPPHNDLIGDMIYQNLQWKSFAKEAILAGEAPLWNPYVLSGTPFLAEGQHGALYPLGAVFYLLPVEQAYAWFTFLHLVMAGAFIYLFLRYLGAGWKGSLVAGVSFEFTSFLVVSFLWPMIVSGIVWAPLLLLFVEMMVRGFEGGGNKLNRALVTGGLGAAAVGTQLLAGHLEISFYLLFTMAVYAAFRLLRLAARTRSIGPPIVAGAGLTIMVGVGMAIAGVLLLPFYELIGNNFRSGRSSFEEVVGYALPLRHAILFAIPDFFGNPSSHSYFDLYTRTTQAFAGSIDPGGVVKNYPFWGIKNYVEGAGYVGIVPLILAGLAIFVRRDGVCRFFVGYGVFSLLIAFGTPLFAVFFFGIPGFDQLNTPFRWLLPFALSTSILAGLAADRIFGSANIAPVAARLVRALSLVAVAAGAAGLLLAALAFVSPGTVQPLFDRIRDSSHLASAAFPDPRSFLSYQIANVAVAAALLLAGGGVVWLALRRPGWRNRLGAAAVALIAVDLFIAGANFNTVTSPTLLDPVPGALGYLASDGPAKGRYADEQLWRIVVFDQENQRPLPPISWMRYGIEDVRGYDTVILDRYVRFWSLMEPPRGLAASQINALADPESLTSPILDLMNVRYVVTSQNIGLPGLVEVYRNGESAPDKSLNIYENSNGLPRAFTMPTEAVRFMADEPAALDRMGQPGFDPRSELLIEAREGRLLVPREAPGAAASTLRPQRVSARTPNSVTVEATLDETGWLVLNETYFPGWRAFIVSGETETEVQIDRAYSIYRTIQLPAGDHTVEFRYSPDSFRLGVFATLLGLLSVGLVLAWAVWRRLSARKFEFTTVQRVVKNSVTPMATQFLNKGLDFAFAIYMLRFLGPENAGKYAFAVFVIGFFLLFVDYGLGTLLTREVARDRSLAKRYFTNTVTLRLGLLVASTPVLAGVIVIYLAFFELTSDTALTIAILAIGILPSAIASSLSAIFNAFETMEVPAAVGVVTNMIRIVFSIAFLLAGFGIVGLAVVSIIASAATVAIFYALVRRRHFRPTVATDLKFQREMLKTSGPLMVNNFLSTIFFRIDVLILRAMRGNSAVGFYTTAYKFVDGLLIIPQLFTLAVFPVMSRLAVDARDRMLFAYGLSLKALIIVSLPISVGTTIIAHQLVVTFFGEAFAPSAFALQIIIWFLPLSYVNSLTHYVLIAANQQRYLTGVFLVGAVFNTVVNIIVIPIYGFAGAAVVTIISEVVLLVPFLWAIERHVGHASLLRISAKPALAAIFMGAVLWWLRDWNFVLLILVGTAIYPAALLALRTFNDDDREVVRQLFRRREAPTIPAE